MHIFGKNQIVHNLSPEYHSDQLRGKNKVLAFRNYGLDVVHKLNSIGFSARIEIIDSQKFCINKEYVVVAQK